MPTHFCYLNISGVCSVLYTQFLAGLLRENLVYKWFIWLFANGPQTGLKQFCKACNRRQELTVLMLYILFLDDFSNNCTKRLHPTKEKEVFV